MKQPATEPTRPAADAPPARPTLSEARGGSVFDRAGLLERSLGDERLAGAILAVFLAEASEAVRALHNASERGNLGWAAEIAYTLRGAAGNVGAPLIGEVAERLRSAAHAQSPEILTLELAPLLAALREFRSAVCEQFPQSTEPTQADPHR
jgi:HPt (histidine-containing phosphotransfer) domain-containing protein